jgi:flavin-dependent dehydrogenase
MKCDLLVLGAGPAGCAAAIRAAISGLKVVIAERLLFPRDLPGEALHPDIEDSLASLGVLNAVVRLSPIRYPGWFRHAHGERTFVPFGGEDGPRFGYQIWRADFDSLLLTRARRLGVSVFQPARIGAFTSTRGKITSMEVGAQKVRFRHLVDSSGANGWTIRNRSLKPIRLTPRLIARYGYVLPDTETGVIPEFRESRCGWTWLARVKHDCSQIVRLALREHERFTPLRSPFNRIQRWQGADVTWRRVQECAGPGYFLCGDAAMVLDPATGNGVARALRSGIQAADLIVQIEAGQLSGAAAAKAYREWAAVQFFSHARQLVERYQCLQSPPDWLQGLGKLAPKI